MRKSVFFLDGSIGVGKTTLGPLAASRLGFGFIDGDDLSGPGHWLRSSLTTSRRIVVASKSALQNHAGLIVSYPLRCTNWLYFCRTFEREGIACYCVGLIADSSAIETPARRLSASERARSREMISQGYGRRPFSAIIIHTDAADLYTTCDYLIDDIRRLACVR